MTVKIATALKPVMKHATDAWLRTNISKAIDDGCNISKAAERLGIDMQTAVIYYNRVMLQRSVPAIHDEHGKVRVFVWDKIDSYFVFSDKRDHVDGFCLVATFTFRGPYKDISKSDWKCPPIDAPRSFIIP